MKVEIKKSIVYGKRFPFNQIIYKCMHSSKLLIYFILEMFADLFSAGTSENYVRTFLNNKFVCEIIRQFMKNRTCGKINNTYLYMITWNQSLFSKSIFSKYPAIITALKTLF